MSLHVYNTYSRKKEKFVPLHDNRVNFYCCGPTVYDYFHIGNARPLIMFDVFRRYLEYSGYEVKYIVNITDIDDKIINRANEEHVDFRAITRKYSDAFFEGMEKLGVRPATVHPLATEHIDEMIEMIGRLITKGHAYVVNGDVYFDISTFPGYGKLSGRDVEHMQAGARVDVDDRKKNPLDFALWKASKPEEPSWDSPWGPGRPGWHIECSVMSMRYAGDTLDIHAGGQDLIFPHHENETAQSEAATGKPFVRYWLHNGFLDIEGEKMSKSLGNFLTVKDILDRYDPMAIRVFFLLKHYRSPIDFSGERMQESLNALNRLKNSYRHISTTLESYDEKKSDFHASLEQMLSIIQKSKEGIIEAMDDDFNTAKAMGHLFDIAKTVNSLDVQDVSASFPVLLFAKEIFDTIGHEVFGLDFSFEIEESKKKELLEAVIDTTRKNNFIKDFSEDDFREKGLTGTLNTIITIRTDARSEKNWALSDLIRDRLKAIGISLEDRPEGTTWKID